MTHVRPGAGLLVRRCWSRARCGRRSGSARRWRDARSRSGAPQPASICRRPAAGSSARGRRGRRQPPQRFADAPRHGRQGFCRGWSPQSARASPSARPSSLQSRRPMRDRRDARAWLRCFRHRPCLELIRPAPAKLPRRAFKAVGNSFDYLEGSSSRTRRRHRSSQQLIVSATDIRPLTPPPDGVCLPLTRNRMSALPRHALSLPDGVCLSLTAQVPIARLT